MNERPALSAPAGPAELTDEELLQITAQAQIYRFQATAGDPVQYEPTEAQLLAAFRAVIAADRARRAAPPAEGEVGELVAALKGDAACIEAGQHDLCSNTADQLTRAAELLERLAGELATLRSAPHA